MVWWVVEVKVRGCKEDAIFACTQCGKNSRIVPRLMVSD